MNKVFTSMERWFRRHSIRNLMNYIVGGMLIVYLADFLLPSLHLSSHLSLNMGLVLRGQIWLLGTVVLLPPNTSLFCFCLLYTSSLRLRPSVSHCASSLLVTLTEGMTF